MKLHSTLITILLLFSSSKESYCQQDFSPRPWKDRQGYDHSIVISEEGKIIRFPQYIDKKTFFGKEIDGKYKIEKCTFVVVDKHETPLTPKGIYAKTGAQVLKNLESAISDANKERVKSWLKSVDPTYKYDDFKVYVQSIINYVKVKDSPAPDTNSPYKNFFPTNLKDYLKGIYTGLANDKFQLVLTPKNNEVSNNCCRTGEPQDTSKTLNLDCKANNEIGSEWVQEGEYHFSIYYINPWAELANGWVSTQKAKNDERKSLMDKIENILKEYDKLIDSIEKKNIQSWEDFINDLENDKITQSVIDMLEGFDSDKSFSKDDFDQFKSLSDFKSLKEDERKRIEMYVDLKLKGQEIDGKWSQLQGKVLKEVGSWELRTLWMTGEGGLNPVYGGTNNADTLKILNDRLKKLKVSLVPYENFQKNIASPAVTGDCDNLACVEEYMSRLETINKLEKRIKVIKASQSRYNAHFMFDTVRIYTGEFYVSSRKNRVFMRNHDGSDDYRLFDGQRKEYFAYENVNYVVHNYQDEGKKVRLHTSGSTIDAYQPTWVKDVNDVFSTLSSVQELPTENVPNFGSKRTAGKKLDVDEIKISKKKLVELQQMLMSQSDFINPNESLLKANQKNEGEFKGTSKRMEPYTSDFQLPAMVSYSFKRFKDDKLDKEFPFNSAFKKYKFKYVQPYAGFQLSFGNVSTISIDEDVFPVQPKSESNYLHFNMGIKIYPFVGVVNKGNCHPAWSRFHGNIGVSIPKPLDNIYTGIGWDIFPGVDISANLLMFKDRDYVIENGLVTQDNVIYRPAFSMGIGMDATVFVNAFKFIFK